MLSPGDTEDKEILAFQLLICLVKEAEEETHNYSSHSKCCERNMPGDSIGEEKYSLRNRESPS